MTAKKWPIIAVLLGLVLAALAMAQQDPVAQYYWSRARAAFTRQSPLDRGAAFSFRAKSLYKRIGEAGNVASTDSTVTDYFYSFGQLDSQKVVVPPTTEMPPVELLPPDIFDSAYVLNFFPNDTGGANLPIGFDTDTLHLDEPTGLAVIDRQNHFLRWLHLYYPVRDGYLRFGRNYRFTQLDGFVFPDSVWEVAAKDGLFYPTHYRLETSITQIDLRR